MLMVLFSFKGSPGVTSTALTLAAAWPRPVTLLEADLAGGDLTFRCRTASGSSLALHRGLLGLAASVRTGGDMGGDVLGQHTQELGNGVPVIVGVGATLQTRGLTNLWGVIADACSRAEVDVVVDAGRIDAATPLMPLLRAADVLLPVAASSLESVVHMQEELPEVLRAASAVHTVPLVIGPDASAARDCGDVDALLARSGLPVSTAQPVPWDGRALHRLESGEGASGRLSRTLLLRGARSLVETLLGDREEGVA